MLTQTKSDFMQIIIKNGLLANLFNYLLKSSVSKDPKNKALIPVAWMEAKITNIRVDAMENCRSLFKPQTVRCKVLKQKQLIFTF